MISLWCLPQMFSGHHLFELLARNSAEDDSPIRKLGNNTTILSYFYSQESAEVTYVSGSLFRSLFVEAQLAAG